MDRDLSQGDDQSDRDEQANDELTTTADGWRSGLQGTDAEDSAEEVATGADRAAEQPGYGREGS